MFNRLAIAIPVLLLLAGCYSKPVRHLASDASLLKAGESSRQEVLRYLGEPDGQRTVAPGVEEYVYFEDVRSSLQRAPLLGSWLDAEGYETLIVTLTGDVVTDLEFRTYRRKDMDWADDFSWQEAE
jgi:hypothetical protein